MSDGIKLWISILLIPFIAAIGHDIYANYFIDEEKIAATQALDIDPAAYQVSDLGYIFETYTPDALTSVRASFEPGVWSTFIDPVLQQFTFVIALVPLALFLLYLGIARLAGLPPYANLAFRPKKGAARDILDKRSENKFKYKR